MHLSLYRKFRPDSFDKIVRQEHIVRILRNQIEQGAVGHAYLFTGPRGTGKTSIARIFARAVCCEHPVDGSPCGVCAACRAAQNSLDIIEIDAASNNSVNDIRELREKAQYPPATLKYKVYIVDEVHMLSDSAFNALLKTLEEPPAHAIFILATTEPQKIPATILSRCMRLDFKLIPEEDLEAHLRRILDELGTPYTPEAIAAIARAGAGSDRDMLSIAEACLVYSDSLTYASVCAVLGQADFGETAALVKEMLTGEGEAAVERAEKILSEGKAVGVLVRDILDCLSRVSIAKNCKTAEQILSLPKQLFDTIRDIALSCDGRAILRATEIFIKTESDLRFVSSPRISLEAALLRTGCPQESLDLDALIVRVAQLEETLKRGIPRSASPAKETTASPAVPNKSDPIPAFFDDAPPLMEEPPFEEEYFEPPAPPKIQEVPARMRPASRQEPPATGAPLEKDAKTVFGKFLRTLRKNSTGVLFTMCSDLIASFEGSVFVLETESDTIYNSLQREQHRNTMKEALAAVGVTEYEIRKRSARKQEDAVEALRRDFKEYPIEIKEK